MNARFFIFLSTLILGVNCVVVNLKDGAINGTTATTRAGRLYYKFLSVPYAKPPVGELRFRPPEPVEPWSGIRDATKSSPLCVQCLSSNVESPGQEDCLYLNVFVPDGLLNSTNKVPVIFNIHGGGFQTGGAGDLDGEYFMDRDVIVVSINYRLGVLGFLAINDIPEIPLLDRNEISGNFGLKDQVLALRWVNENIAQFGGDSANITLMGESAGGVSVHFHMFSPLSKGLFQKAIMQSGSAFSPWSHFPANYKINDLRLDQLVAINLIQKSGCLFHIIGIAHCLRNLPTENFTQPGGFRNLPIYLPTIELKANETQAFLPYEPNATNYQTQVPWIAGINSGEAAAIVPIALRNGSYFAKELNSNKSATLPLMNLYFLTAKKEDMNKISQAVDDFYFNPEDIGLETALHFVDMITDSSWLYPLQETIKHGPNLQYVYLYDHRGTYSGQDSMNLTIDLGVGHSDDSPLLYRIPKLEAKRSLADRRVSDTLLRFWINFAISADPNRHSKEKVWIPVQTKDIEYLHIKSDGVTMEKNMFGKRFELWDSLPTGWKKE